VWAEWGGGGGRVSRGGGGAGRVLKDGWTVGATAGKQGSSYERHPQHSIMLKTPKFARLKVYGWMGVLIRDPRGNLHSSPTSDCVLTAQGRPSCYARGTSRPGRSPDGHTRGADSEHCGGGVVFAGRSRSWVSDNDIRILWQQIGVDGVINTFGKRYIQLRITHEAG